MKTTFRLLVFAIAVTAFIFTPVALISQETTETTAEPAPKKKSDKPVRSPWMAGMLIETQTDYIYSPKTLEFVLQHRFGALGSESFDLGGLFAPSNIRFGFNYVLFENAQVGYGITKDGIVQDVNWKYKILTQTKSNSMPIALTYYGNIQISSIPSSDFGANYSFSKRLSYFNQIIVSRKFTKKLTMQVSFNYAHFNQIDTTVTGMSDLTHDNFGFGIAGRYKVGKNTSVMVEYDQPFTTPELIKPNLSLGIELGTSSHVFQIFVSTYKGISYQNNMVYNRNDFTNFEDGNWGILLGFNMTRNWNF